MSRQANIVSWLSGEYSNGGINYDHVNSNLIEQCGEKFCPAGVATAIYSQPLQFTYGKGNYSGIQIFITGITSSGGAAEVCNASRGIQFNVNKDGTVRTTNIYNQAAGTSNVAFTITTTTTTTPATVANGVVTSLPLGNVFFNPSRDCWVSWEADLLFCYEI